jgi:GNAT superfamily N-acetyltransferase
VAVRPVIRPVAAADFPQWAPLWEGYNTFYEPKLPDQVTRATWARLPGRERAGSRDGRRAGRAIARPRPLSFHHATATIGLSCYLSDLFTTKAARGKGVGRALIEAVYEKARSAGSTRVYGQTHKTDRVAQTLYEKVAERSGFIVYRKQV